MLGRAISAVHMTTCYVMLKYHTTSLLRSKLLLRYQRQADKRNRHLIPFTGKVFHCSRYKTSAQHMTWAPTTLASSCTAIRLPVHAASLASNLVTSASSEAQCHEQACSLLATLAAMMPAPLHHKSAHCTEAEWRVANNSLRPINVHVPRCVHQQHWHWWRPSQDPGCCRKLYELSQV